MNRSLHAALLLLALFFLRTPTASASTPSYYVTDTSDDVNDTGSLRSAITRLNASGTVGLISINLSDPNNTTIAVSTPLPHVGQPVTITGGNTRGSNGSPIARIDGSGVVGDGLVFDARAEVDSLVITGFGGTGVVFNSGSSKLQGCYIGVAADGSAVGNSAGVIITSSNCAIGTGTSTTQRNVISGNHNGPGIWLSGSGATANAIFCNLIGTDPTGASPASSGTNNNSDGIRITNGSSNQIGMVSGTVNSNYNTISGNNANGLSITGGSNNKIDGNVIGMDSTGSANTVPNGDESGGGVWIDNSAGTRITRNVISGNGGPGLQIADGAHDTTVTSNNIGVDLTGSSGYPNQGDGIVLGDAASNNPVWNNHIGGADAGNGTLSGGLGNVISANTLCGINVVSGSGDVISGNYIGVAVDSSVLGNGVSGVQITGTNETVGGAQGIGGNVISGNAQDGILVANSGSVTIIGNIVGLDVTGTTSAGNGSDGVYCGIDIRASDFVQVGGSNAALGNVISANSGAGICIFGDSNAVLGNNIGCTAGGDCPGVGNCTASSTCDGITIVSGSQNTIGGIGTGQGNLIVGNGGCGVHLNGPFTFGNYVLGNAIGATLDWLGEISNADSSTANALPGVQIDGMANNNVIGTVTGGGNQIATAGVDAVYVSDSGSNLNTIRGNSTLLVNGALPIDLASDANDSPGVPSLDSGVALSGTQLLVTGACTVNPGETCFVDVYGVDPNAAWAAYGYLTSVQTTADGSGNLSYSIPLNIAAAGQTLAVAVTNSVGDTSEFSPDVAVPNVIEFTSGTAPMTISESSASGGDNVLHLTVTRLGDLTNGSLESVIWTTRDLSARAGVDYAPASGTAVFAKGSGTAQIDITIEKNSALNGVRVFQIVLGNRSSTTTLLGDQNVVTVSILDDQAPYGVFSVAAATPFVDKGKVKSVQFVIKRDGGTYPPSTISPAIAYMTANGTATAGSKKDYTAVSNTLHFSPTQTSASVTVPISTTAPYKANPWFWFKLTGCSSGCALAPGASSAVQTICDLSNPRGAVEFGATSFKANETGPALLTVTRHGGSLGTQKVSFTASNDGSANAALAGVNYRTTSGSVVFKPGQKSAVISIATVDDRVYTANRQFLVSLGSVSGGATCGALRTASVVLLDNDNPNGVLQFSGTSVNAGKNARSVTVKVSRLGGANGAVSVPYSFHNGTAHSGANFTGRNGVLTFADGVARATLNVPLVSGGHHPAQAFTITLGAPTGGATLALYQTVTVHLPAY